MNTCERVAECLCGVVDAYANPRYIVSATSGVEPGDLIGDFKVVVANSVDDVRVVPPLAVDFKKITFALATYLEQESNTRSNHV